MRRTAGNATGNPPPALPPEFLARMARLLGDEYEAFLASYAEVPPAVLRVNTLKISPERFGEIAPFTVAPVNGLPGAFAAPEDEQPGKHPYHAAGLYYIQDPSAMRVAQALAPKPGERVLDLSAAPGGKATQIAALMGNQGLLVANEIHPRRVWDLAENLERWGATHAAITNETPARLAERFEGFFDRVLLDAPCSGEGMFRKNPAARLEWSAELVQGCALRQSAIIEDAARAVRPGGILAYSTCTFAPDEDEGVIERFLEAHEDFEIVEPENRDGAAPGRPDWIGSQAERPELERAMRLWPQQRTGEGHFIALLVRSGTETAAPDDALPWRFPRLSPQARSLYQAFCAENLSESPGDERLVQIGSYLYQAPPDLPDLAGLRFIHPGWWLGTIKKDRFEPAHSLAMALRPGAARRQASFSAGSRELLAYLRGESVADAGEDGWVLVTVDGFPIGWGKRVKGALKSHYPKGLRRV